MHSKLNPLIFTSTSLLFTFWFDQSDDLVSTFITQALSVSSTSTWSDQHFLMNPHRSLASHEHEIIISTLNKAQNHAVLVAGLTCACFSLAASLFTLQCFLLMKRTYRHHLVMGLIVSDTCKAIWYFIFPLVVFTRGAVSSASPFCQVSGWFLLVAIESADLGILFIALHAILYIFRPPTRSGEEGGLYPFRKIVITLWIIFPMTMASLAFVNEEHGYTTAGTYCYLPRRPFWYRLALSWIPRYCILFLILSMYTAVYVYVTTKFKSFNNLSDSGSNESSDSQSRQSSVCTNDLALEEQHTNTRKGRRSTVQHQDSPVLGENGNGQTERFSEAKPWDQMSFATTGPLQSSSNDHVGVATSDFAVNARATKPPAGQGPLWNLDGPFIAEGQGYGDADPNSRKRYRSSETSKTMFTPRHSAATIDSVTGNVIGGQQPNTRIKMHDPLRRTRKAIRKQLRYMFIYPAVYVCMWIFPLASHILSYSDYYVRKPIYWLTIATTCCLGLQAAIDCVVFSWTEKPWRRIPDSRKISVSSLKALFHRGSKPQQRSHSDTTAVGDIDGRGTAQYGNVDSPLTSPGHKKTTKANKDWWEAEGLKRKDSVWLGTDTDPKSTLAHMPSSDTVFEEINEDQAGSLLAQQK